MKKIKLFLVLILFTTMSTFASSDLTLGNSVFLPNNGEINNNVIQYSYLIMVKLIIM